MSKEFIFVSETPERREARSKREPNMFIMFRKNMMKHKPPNMTMRQYSKLVSKWWEKLSIDKKDELRRQYQIQRDRKKEKGRNEHRVNFNTVQTQVPADITYLYCECEEYVYASMNTYSNDYMLYPLPLDQIFEQANFSLPFDQDQSNFSLPFYQEQANFSLPLENNENNDICYISRSF
ncbi:14857_t:CDS:1 [Funneliformis geosporum]|uniref:6275_t:CDS:1 n=1 Tax=Funneliformis geosporum TaxID=1117311 RepID=A0A9W4WJI1_9GLOM|nr:14857_t:CDS:1 [Funneliformis geosporum]CAI2166485.1 6275_t:CDS:1 [Funneliformis geosporum]